MAQRSVRVPNVFQNHYCYTGKERDTESGLDNFGARYYASSMVRCMRPDWASNPQVVPYASYANPQSLNLYNYVLNNSLGGINADGHWPGADQFKDFGIGLLKSLHNAVVSSTSVALNGMLHAMNPEWGTRHNRPMSADGDMQAAGMQAGNRIIVAASVIDVSAGAFAPLETVGAEFSATLPEEGQTEYLVPNPQQQIQIKSIQDKTPPNQQ